ncbi:MAG TPA: hypothetical protein VLB82_00505 [Thermodesulfobacteriota bacterium]|nr:hypothetical protein [Thermodesulfobacteriota bacterium]
MEYNLESIPENLRRFIDPSLDRDTRIMAARGLIPIPPEDMALVLYYLTFDKDDEVVNESKQSLFTLPYNTLERVLSNESVPDGLLDYFAKNTENDIHFEKIIINNATSDSTIQYLAENIHNQYLIELISDNHQRILRSHEIVYALSKNPAISRSNLDKVISFISLYLEKEVNIPQALQDSSEEPQQVDQSEAIVESVESSFLDEVEIPEEFLEEEGEEGELDLEEEQSPKYQNLFFAIKSMTLPEKLKLCIMGNAEARRILVKEPNRVVALAALKNPRMTDMEINIAAQSTSVSEEVLREISNNRDWTKHYDIKVSLVTNPKSPADVSMNFIRHMRDKDLKLLSRSKNVPGVVSTAARRILMQKEESQKLKLQS